MREARSYIGGAFAPVSAAEIVALITSGTKEGSYILQVYGYWDMVAAFVIHGALPAELVYDTCQEMYFQYSKLHPFLISVRELLNLPEWMRSIETVVEGSKAGRRRLAQMQHNVTPASQGGSRPSENTQGSFSSHSSLIYVFPGKLQILDYPTSRAIARPAPKTCVFH